MCVESEQPSYIFYYICDLFYHFYLVFFACLLHTYILYIINTLQVFMCNVTSTTFCCVPFFQCTLIYFDNLLAVKSLAEFMYQEVTEQCNLL